MKKRTAILCAFILVVSFLAAGGLNSALAKEPYLEQRIALLTLAGSYAK